jgi:hypothetical protein
MSKTRERNTPPFLDALLTKAPSPEPSLVPETSSPAIKPQEMMGKCEGSVLASLPTLPASLSYPVMSWITWMKASRPAAHEQNQSHSGPPSRTSKMQALTSDVQGHCLALLQDRSVHAHVLIDQHGRRVLALHERHRNGQQRAMRQLVRTSTRQQLLTSTGATTSFSFPILSLSSKVLVCTAIGR